MLWQIGPRQFEAIVIFILSNADRLAGQTSIHLLPAVNGSFCLTLPFRAHDVMAAPQRKQAPL